MSTFSSWILAAQRGDVSRIISLLSEGIDINTQTSYRAPALIFASLNGYDSLLSLLIERGADLNIQTSDVSNCLVV